MPESLESSDRWRTTFTPTGRDGAFARGRGGSGNGLVGVPARDMALEKRLDMDEAAGLIGAFWGVETLLPPAGFVLTGMTDEVGVGAISCSILLRMGSLLISAVLCIQVPVLMSSSCFFLHKMHTQII